MQPARRSFLKTGSIALAAIAIVARAGASRAQAKGPARLEEKDAAAAALGYKHDAAKVDRKKFGNWQAGQSCANCMQFKGKPADAWADCGIFPGKQVAGKGWCAAWQKKA